MISPDENLLVGNWVFDGKKMFADETAERIDRLVLEHLERLATSGWDTLYRDPNDGRLWEYIYPLSHMHGAGPPTLQCVSPELARRKYGFRPRS